jgi:hypothetical protein
MFRVVPPPIIRRAYNCIYSMLFVTPLLLSAAIVEEMEPVWVYCGWRTPPTAHSNQPTRRRILEDSIIVKLDLICYRPLRSFESIWERGGIAPHIHNLGTKMGVSDWRPGRFILLGKVPSFYSTWGFVGPQTCLNALKKKKKKLFSPSNWTIFLG